MEYVNTWGVCGYYQGLNDNEIYEKDKKKFCNINPLGKLFNCIGEKSGYLVIMYGVNIFMVTNKIYKIVTEPKHKIGDTIR